MEEKLICPAMPKSCKFLDANSDDGIDSTYESKYNCELHLEKRICHSCGRAVHITESAGEYCTDSNLKFICDDCKKEMNNHSWYSNYHQRFILMRRKSIIAGSIVGAVAYALFLIIAFFFVNTISTQRYMLMVSPAVFYTAFSIVYCFAGNVSPVYSVFSDGFEWVKDSIGDAFDWVGRSIASAFGWVLRAFTKPFTSGSGFFILIFVIFLGYFLAFFAVCSAAIIAFFTVCSAAIIAFFAVVSAVLLLVVFVLSIFVSPFSTISRYSQN